MRFRASKTGIISFSQMVYTAVNSKVDILMLIIFVVSIVVTRYMVAYIAFCFLFFVRLAL